MTLEISGHLAQHNQAYPSPYSVDDETSTTFVVLPGVRYKNRHLGVLVEDLLYARVVHTPSEISVVGRLGIVCSIILFIAKIILVGQVVRRILARRMAGGRGRGGLAVKQSCTTVRISDPTISSTSRAAILTARKSS